MRLNILLKQQQRTSLPSLTLTQAEFLFARFPMVAALKPSEC